MGKSQFRLCLCLGGGGGVGGEGGKHTPWLCSETLGVLACQGDRQWQCSVILWLDSLCYSGDFVLFVPQQSFLAIRCAPEALHTVL